MRFSKLDSLYKQLHMSLCKLASHRWCYGDDIFTKRSASTPTTTFALLVSSKAEDLVQLNRFSLVVPLLSQLEAAKLMRPMSGPQVIGMVLLVEKTLLIFLIETSTNQVSVISS